MASPRYRPRDYCHPPEVFGKAEMVRWHPTPHARGTSEHVAGRVAQEQLALMGAAKIQHLYALRIRAHLKAQKLSLLEYARKTGHDSGKRIGAFLRGEVIMRFDDLAWADLILGDVSEQAARDSANERRRNDAFENEVSRRLLDTQKKSPISADADPQSKVLRDLSI